MSDIGYVRMIVVESIVNQIKPSPEVRERVPKVRNSLYYKILGGILKAGGISRAFPECSAYSQKDSAHQLI